MEEEKTETQETQTQVSQPAGKEPILKHPILKKLPGKNMRTPALLSLIALLVILAGVGTGWVLTGSSKEGGILTPTSGVAPGAKKGPTEAGLADEATFRDSAEGVLEEGGIEGEGTHHLVREGGESQSVYLTSTVIDLQSFVGKNVTVWGETIAARKAGWLMDVGKIKVSE